MNYIYIRNSTIILILVLFTSVSSLPQQTNLSNRDSLRNMRIMLRAYSFDPLKEMPKIEGRLRLTETPQEEAYRLIQFKKALTRKEIELLKAQYKLRLEMYIPNFTYLEKLTPEQMKPCRNFPTSGGSGNY